MKPLAFCSKPYHYRHHPDGYVVPPVAQTFFCPAPSAYLLIERRLRKRSWGDLGFKGRTFGRICAPTGFCSWFMVFVIQPATALWAKTDFPRISSARPGAGCF